MNRTDPEGEESRRLILFGKSQRTTCDSISHRRLPRIGISKVIDRHVLSRFPNTKEKALMLRAFAEAEDDRQAAVEDILWALMNTRGFVYNH